jgi:peptide/nickel transport system ATP-binding protein
VDFGGTDLLHPQLRAMRRKVQIVFQDPFAALDPRQKVGDAVARGPMAYGTSAQQAFADARRLLARSVCRRVLRIAIRTNSRAASDSVSASRALALKPLVLVADEAVSALDVSVQALILALLAELREEMNLAVIFITHDLRTAAEIADRIIVMRHGEIVEQGETQSVFLHPRHAYTRELLAAIPGVRLFAGPGGARPTHVTTA